MGDNTHLEIWMAGAAAAFTVDLLVYPLDTIKTRWQSQDFLTTYASSSGAKKVPTNVFRGLYQGVGSVVLATLPAAGVFFTTYESAKTLYAGVLPSGVPQPAVHSLASATAELASCLVLTPAEVIKQNAQMLRRSGGSGGGSTSLRAWRMLKQGEGGAARRLWRGYTALAARNLPHTAIQFPVFEFVRGKLWDRRDRRQAGEVPGSRQRVATSRDGEELQEKIQAAEARSGPSRSVLLETWLINAASAGLSGALAAVLTTPTDVVKTRMMLTGDGGRQDVAEEAHLAGRRTPSHGTARRMGSWEVAKQVYRERGVKGLFRGGALRAVWTALASGLYLGTYEVSKVWLRGGKGMRDYDL